jgi:hypothetical protein
MGASIGIDRYKGQKRRPLDHLLDLFCDNHDFLLKKGI